jgi:UDP-N-acetylglucosamine 2-epimerase (non-hydrolysing)
MPKFLIIAGARPNFMKVGPVYRALQSQNAVRHDVEIKLVHTGQHYSPKMSQEFFRDLNIPDPDFNLEVGSGTHAEQTARVMMAFEPVCVAQKPDCVVVVGDVNSTMACAITAKKLGIRVAHVEAGLRSGDLSMPEEINRLCTDCISDLLFTTDEGATANLLREGVAAEKIHFVGNTMIDTLRENIDRATKIPLPQGLRTGNYAVLTLHRPSNVDSSEKLASVLEAVGEIAAQMPVVFPVHPRTAARLTGMTLNRGIRAVEPMGYLEFIGLVARSRMVLTDSGGIQEETTVLGVPCLTMRPNTERPITCEIGTNILVGSEPANIVSAAKAVVEGSAKKGRIPEKWDGNAANRIAEVLVAHTY